MHIEPGLLLLPYSNRWSAVPAGRKAALCGFLLVTAIAPFPVAVPLTIGLVAGLLACLGAGIRLHTWAELLVAPLLFTAAGGVVIALSSPHGTVVAAHTLARVFGAASATLLLATTTPVLDLLALLPASRGFRTLHALFTLSYRAVAALCGAGLEMINAIRVRNLGQSWRNAPGFYGSFAGALAIRSLEKARRSEIGIELRGFTSRMPYLPPLRGRQ